MLKVKRKLPPLLLEAERLVEAWRADLIRSVHERPDAAIYTLTVASCAAIGNAGRRGVPPTMVQLEAMTRHYLSGLQFALTGIEGDIAGGELVEEDMAQSVSAEHARRGLDAVEAMARYAHVRDAYLTYAWGGYEVEGTERDLRFRDVEGWTGARDRAEQLLRDEIETEWLRASAHLAHSEPLRPVGIPSGLSLGGVNADEFVAAWNHLRLASGEAFMLGGVPVESRGALRGRVQAAAHLDAAKAEAALDLLTFDRTDHALGLFHCPLVPVTAGSFLVVPPGLFFGNPLACVPRLAVRRAGGLGAYGKTLEAWLLGNLREQFTTREATVETLVSYSSKNDRGDIDLVVYEVSTNRLLIAMLKAFVLPDSVEEVMHANREIEKGLRQIERARHWLDVLPFDQWKSRLRMPLIETPPAVRYAVIGNGFIGSDWLEIPDWVTLVDARYLLLPRFRGASIAAALDAYTARLKEHEGNAVAQSRISRFHLGDVKVEVPSWDLIA